ncbi:MAG: MipA/OmpV family protein [Alphaproteobacteria bacterium]
MRIRARVFCLASLAAALLYAFPATAQTPTPLSVWQFSAGQVLAPYGKESPNWLVLVGPSFVYQSKYEGSKDYNIEAGAVLDIRYKGRLYLSTGEGVGYDVFRGKNYRIGGGIAYDIGRRDNQDGIRGLGNVSPTPQARLYMDYVFRPRMMGHEVPVILSIDTRRAIGEYNGFIANVGGYVPIAGSEAERYFVFLGASGTYWDKRTAQTYFGVTPAQSARSGLPVFNADRGPESFGAGLSAGWFMTDHWLITGDLAVKRILHDFDNSPVVREPWSAFASLSIAYAF